MPFQSPEHPLPQDARIQESMGAEGPGSWLRKGSKTGEGAEHGTRTLTAEMPGPAASNPLIPFHCASHSRHAAAATKLMDGFSGFTQHLAAQETRSPMSRERKLKPPSPSETFSYCEEGRMGRALTVSGRQVAYTWFLLHF